MKKLPVRFLCLLAWMAAGCSPGLGMITPTLPMSPSPSFASPTPARPLGSTPTYPLTPTSAGAGGGEATPTPDMIHVVMAANPPKMLPPLLSPDGVWRAEVLIYPCVRVNGEGEYAFEQLKLVHLPDGQERIADSQLQVCGGLGAFGLKALFWSANGRYLYYTDAREGLPDGCGYWTPPYLRLDLATMERHFLGGGAQSPDGAKLATLQERAWVVWEVNGGEMGRFPLLFPEFEVGPLAWSPDSQALVYLQVGSFCPPSGPSYGVLISLSDLQQSLLLESQQHFGAVFWGSQDELRLLDEQGMEWRYNFKTRALSP